MIHFNTKKAHREGREKEIKKKNSENRQVKNHYLMYATARISDKMCKRARAYDRNTKYQSFSIRPLYIM